MTQKQPLEVRFVADEDVLDHIVEKQQGKSVSLKFYINNFMRSIYVCFTKTFYTLHQLFAFTFKTINYHTSSIFCFVIPYLPK